MRLASIFIFLFCVAIEGVSQEIPLRDEADYNLKLDYEFRIKTVFDSDKVSFVKNEEDKVLPHLSVSIDILNLPPESHRIKIVDNKRNIKFAGRLKGEPIKFKMGFTNDMKKGTTPNIFYIMVLTKKKDPINQIILEVMEDGNFMVNNELNGKL